LELAHDGDTPCVKVDTKCVANMRSLQWITGSVARALIIAHVVDAEGSPHSVARLSEVLGVPRTGVVREMRRLVAAGVLREAPFEGKRSAALYELDARQPGLVELRRFVQLNLGAAGQIRDAVHECSPRSLAWIYGAYAEGRLFSRSIRVVVLTHDRRSVTAKLASIGERMAPTEIVVDAMSLKEWTYRLQRREFRALRLRRTQRMWLLGSDEELRRAEAGEIRAKETLKKLMANWREELSDDWDDSWDPFHPFSAVPR
jgi:DNA-binding Lrp family transcriptional regulator